MKIDLTFIIVLLIILKVTGVISWSWWIVLFPIVLVVGFISFVFAILAVAFILSLFLGTAKPKFTWKKKE